MTKTAAQVLETYEPVLEISVINPSKDAEKMLDEPGLCSACSNRISYPYHLVSSDFGLFKLHIGCSDAYVTKLWHDMWIDIFGIIGCELN